MKDKDKFEFISNTEIEENKNDPPKISGFAIHPGLYNKIVEIPDEELENIANTLKNSQLRIDHGFSVRDVIGIVNDAYKTFDETVGKEAVKYYAETDDEEILNKMSKGYINACSIGFAHNSLCSKCGEDFHKCEHNFEEAHVICKDCEVFELSIVTQGADGDATAGVSGFTKDLETRFKKQFSDKTLEDEKSVEQNKDEGGKVMEPEDKSQPLNVAELVTAIKNAESESLKKDEKIDTLKEKLEDLETFKKDIQEQISNDKTKTETEKKQLTNELKEKTQALEQLSSEVRLREATKLAEREIAVGLIKEAEKDEEIKKLSESQTMIDHITPIIEKLEAQKEEKGEKKVPENSDFEKAPNKKVNKDSQEFMQALVHQVFKYDRNFGDDKYMGFKKNAL